MTYYVYILECRGGRLYTGITTDIARRFSEHSGGVKGAKFTHANPPEKIAAVWSCEGRSAASKLEYAIKKLRREQKIQLIESENSISQISDSCMISDYSREEIF